MQMYTLVVDNGRAFVKRAGLLACHGDIMRCCTNLSLFPQGTLKLETFLSERAAGRLLSTAVTSATSGDSNALQGCGGSRSVQPIGYRVLWADSCAWNMIRF
jgi:hypothetical protein